MKIQPPEATADAPAALLPDLGDTLKELTQGLKQNLTAQTTAKLFKALASDDDSPVSKGLGEAIGSLANGMKGVTELQNLTLQSALKHLTTSSDGSTGSPERLMQYLLVMMMLKQMMREEEPTPREQGPSWKDVIELLDRHYRELREAERGHGPSEIDQYIHQAATQAVVQAMQPRSLTDQVKELTDHVQALRQIGLVGDSRGDLQRELIDLDREKVRREHDLKLAELQDRQRARQEDYPQLAQSLLGGLQQLAAQFGFRPVQPHPGSVVAPGALAAAQAQAAGAQG
jgi:hypothetical protein